MGKKRESLSRKVFLEAARRVDEHEDRFCCIAISYAKGQLEGEWFMYYCEEKEKFIKMMLDGDEKSQRFWDDSDLRVLALCFMAAMED